MDLAERIPDEADQSQAHKRPTDTFSDDGEAELRFVNHQLQLADVLFNQQANDIYGWSDMNMYTPGQTSHSTSNSNVALLKRSDSRLSEPDKAARKREIDRLYRKRRKIVKEEMQNELETLTSENEYLKKENGSFKKDNASMNQTLKDQAKEIDRLRNDLLQLKREYDKQNVLVQTLSGLLADPVRLENEKLKDENDLLKRNNFGNSVLVEENVKLKLENKVLKVQIDALCGKIIYDSDTKHGQEITARLPSETV